MNNYFRSLFFTTLFYVLTSFTNASLSSQKQDVDFISCRSLSIHYKEDIDSFYELLNQGDIKKAKEEIIKWIDRTKKNLKFYDNLQKSVIYLQKKPSFKVPVFNSNECAEVLLDKWTLEDSLLSGNLGYSLYQQNDFEGAKKYLEIAANNNDPIAQRLCADISYINLDDRYSPLKEAAMWYLLSYENGNSDSAFVLKNLVANLDNLKTPNEKMIEIVRCWAVQDTVHNNDIFEKILPENIVDYLLLLDQKIDLIGSQKLPYIFDKAFHAILYSATNGNEDFATISEFRIIEDEVEPTLEDMIQDKKISRVSSSKNLSRPCSQEAYKLRVKDQNPYWMGPVYQRYRIKLMDAGYDFKDFLKKTLK